MGNKTIFCGDGINDLPALAAADVGISVGATDAVIAAAVSTPQGSVAGQVTTALQSAILWCNCTSFLGLRLCCKTRSDGINATIRLINLDGEAQESQALGTSLKMSMLAKHSSSHCMLCVFFMFALGAFDIATVVAGVISFLKISKSAHAMMLSLAKVGMSMHGLLAIL